MATSMNPQSSHQAFQANNPNRHVWSGSASSPQFNHENRPFSIAPILDTATSATQYPVSVSTHDAAITTHRAHNSDEHHHAQGSNAGSFVNQLPWLSRFLLKRFNLVLVISVAILITSIILMTIAITLAAVHRGQYSGDGALKSTIIILGVVGFTAFGSSSTTIFLACQWLMDRGRLEDEERAGEEARVQDIEQGNYILRALRYRHRLMQQRRSSSQNRIASGEEPGPGPSLTSLSPSPMPSTSAPTAEQRASDWMHDRYIGNNGSEHRSKDSEKDQQKQQRSRANDLSSRPILPQLNTSIAPSATTPDDRPNQQHLSTAHQLYGLPSSPPPRRPLPPLPASPLARNRPSTPLPQSEIHPLLRIQPPNTATSDHPSSPVTVVPRSPTPLQTSQPPPPAAGTTTTPSPTPPQRRQTPLSHYTIFPPPFQPPRRHSNPLELQNELLARARGHRPAQSAPQNPLPAPSNTQTGALAQQPAPQNPLPAPTSTPNLTTPPPTNASNPAAAAPSPPSSPQRLSPTPSLQRLRNARSHEVVTPWLVASDGPFALAPITQPPSAHDANDDNGDKDVNEGGEGDDDDDEEGEDGTGAGVPPPPPPGSESDSEGGGGDKMVVEEVSAPVEPAEGGENGEQGGAEGAVGMEGVEGSRGRRGVRARLRGLGLGVIKRERSR
ncbi:hypothetical protein ACLMJK_004648 [Lecanora helva]